MNQSQTRSPRKRWLSLILAVVLMIGLLPISAFASNTGAQADDSGSAVVDNRDFLRIFHLDCGRKYFSVSEIEGIIDQLAANHYTHIQLAFGNDGLRFLLDDMSVTVNGTEYDKDRVKSAVQSGNKAYYNAGSVNELTQTDMDAIIKYANDKGIQVIPMFNTPYHMNALLSAMETLGMSNVRMEITTTDDRGNKSTNNNYLKLVDNDTAVAFVKALQQKYMDYFKGKGCKYYNIATDEYAFDNITDTVYTKFAEYVNDLAQMVKGSGMTPLAYNDGFYWTNRESSVEFDTDIVICYWSNGGHRASAETLAGEGFKILNNSDEWYYVLGDYLYKAWGTSGQWGYADALKGLENTKVTQVKGDTDGKVAPIGSVLCCWCDGPSMGYNDDGYSDRNHASAGQKNQESVYKLIEAMAKNNPDYFKEYTAPQPEVKVNTASAQGVTVSAAGDSKYQVILPENGGGSVQLSLDNSTAKYITWTSDNEDVATVDVDTGLVTFTGKIGNVTITAIPQSPTNAGETAGYTVTFEVKAAGEATKTENIVLTVGGTKTINVDGVQSILTQPDAQYATAATKDVPSETVSYTATASAQDIEAYGNNDVSNLIDGNTETYFFSSKAPGVGAYVQVDLKKTIPFDAVRLTSCKDDFCKNAAVQVSADGDSWTTIGSYTGSTTATTFDVNGNIGSVRYIRVEITEQVRANNGNYCWWKLAEIEWGNYDNGKFTRMETSGTVTVPEQTQITFTGVAVGSTVARIGDTEYNIQVKGRIEIPITIIDYRADGLLFDFQVGDETYDYGLVHNYDSENSSSFSSVTSNGGTLVGSQYGTKIAGTTLENTGYISSDSYSGQYYLWGNKWSRSGMVEDKLGSNGMPVYTDATVARVAQELTVGNYNSKEMGSVENDNDVIYDTFLKSGAARSVVGEDAEKMSTTFASAKTWSNITNAYDLAWYLLNTLYQADTNTTEVTGTDGQTYQVPIYGMGVDAYDRLILTEKDGIYSFDAANEKSNYDTESRSIYEDDTARSLQFYPIDGLGYDAILGDTTDKTDSPYEKDEKGNITGTVRPDHPNGSYTLRGEAQFVYQDNLYFEFSGDDDVYMYINGVLALDLGGAHGICTKRVNLKDVATKCHLTPGEVATFTFFYMERNSDASNFKIETNMELVQRDIDVQKKAYDTSYANEIPSNMSVPTETTVAYDLILTNKSNSVMNQIKFTDTDDCEAAVSFGYGVDSPEIATGTKTKADGSVTLGALSSSVIYITEGDNENEKEVANTRQTLTSLEELSKAVAATELQPGQTLHVRFLTATFSVKDASILSYLNTVTATASVGGTSLSDTASHELYSYNANDIGRTYVVDFGLPLRITNIFSVDAGNIGNVKLNSANTLKYGTVTLTGESAGVELVYTRTANKTVDNAETIVLDVVYKMGNSSVTLQKTLTIIPASNVYYEDSLASFTDGKGVAEKAKWSVVDNDGNENATETTNVYQALEELGKGERNVYGYDTAYNSSSMLSMGTAHKVTVTSDMLKNWTTDDTKSAWPTASFTFTGTGFDVISLTNNKSGAIFVDVYNGGEATGDPVKTLVVNNYYGYTYDENTKTWNVTPNGDNALYQIPVMKVDGLAYGEHTVVIKVAYSGYFDTANRNEYSFWLDAIRVYNPMGENGNSYYTQDNEGYPQYIKLRDELANTAATSGDEKVVFIDGADKASIADYANYGPNNEVYLAKGQAISFKVSENAQIASIQIGAKAPDGKAAKMVVNNGDPIELGTATEMYYDITEQAKDGQLVTIANKDDGILSLTNLKITYKDENHEEVKLESLTAQQQANAVAMVQALFAAPVETFQPERFEASWGGSVRAGRKATLTVKTSEDVDAITVDGVTVSSYTTRTERTGWGWWSPKVTYRVFTYTITATATADYQVCAVSSTGVASDPITATLTVRPATWWNWWF